jgi:hypothetical protein
VESEANQYAAKAKAVVVRHVSTHQVVAMVEIISPGNKASQRGFDALIRKARETLAAGIHMSLIDLFPPGPRDPLGIHVAVWGSDEKYAFSGDRPLTCVAYIGGPGAAAYINPVAVGDPLPETPLFLTPDVYVPMPLEADYQAAWEGMPAYWRNVLSTAVRG